jgi:flagellar motor switch protein FliM
MSDPISDARSVRRYVFYDQHRPSRAWMPKLEVINERFCQHLRTALVQHLRPGVDVIAPLAIQLIKHSELIEKMARPSHLTLVELKPLRGTILVVVDAPLVSWIVESRFGGNGRFPIVIEGRDFSPFERKAACRVVQTVVEQLVLAWQPIASFEPRIARYESNPQLAGIANPGDQIIFNIFDMQVARGGGKLSIGIPYGMLEPLHDQLAGDGEDATTDVDPHWQETLKLRVGQATLTLRVELTTLQATVGELLALRPGIVFDIDRPERVTLEANGVPLFRGRWGNHGPKIGVRIEERLEAAIDILASARPDKQEARSDE